MILKTLGILDIFCALYMILLHTGIGSLKFTLLISGYLVLKLIFSYKSLTGYIDLLIATYIWKIYFSPSVMDFVPIIYLIQKGIVSLI